MVMPIFVSWDMPIFGLDYRSGGSASLKLDDEAMSNSAQVFSRHPPVADRRHCVLTSSSRIYLRPNPFVRVQFRGIRGKVFNMQTTGAQVLLTLGMSRKPDSSTKTRWASS